MFTIFLESTILPIILMVLFLFVKQKLNLKLLFIFLNLLLFVIDYGFIYLFLPSRNLLSIIIINVFNILCLNILATFCNLLHFNKNNIYTLLISMGSWAIESLLIIISLVGFVRTHFIVQNTYRSIDKQISTSKEAPTFKRNETPIALSPETVHSRANKCLSDIRNNQYYSLADKDNIQAQFLNGKPEYLIPIEFNGLFSYLNSDKTIPGYFKINAVDPSATPQFVKCKMKYSNSAYLGHNAEREIYRHYPEYITSASDPQLQIGPHNVPYWVETLYLPDALSHRNDYHNMKIAILNSQTGKTNLYDANKNLPKWISEGVTSDVASDMNKIFGKDKYSIFTQWFNKVGQMKPTMNGPENGVTSIFNSNGTVSYFADFTNCNSDNNSCVGYSMIDARTGKLTFYKTKGIMDSNGAKSNANENYKAQGWKSYLPIIYNIGGRPVWVMQILDNTHAIRNYYYLDAANQSVHANGTDVNSALDSFLQSLANNQIAAGNSATVKTRLITGKVDRVGILSSQHAVLFTLQNSSTVYSINTQDFNKAVLIKSGDTVSFKAKVLANKIAGNISSFKDQQLN